MSAMADYLFQELSEDFDTVDCLDIVNKMNGPVICLIDMVFRNNRKKIVTFKS